VAGAEAAGALAALAVAGSVSVPFWPQPAASMHRHSAAKLGCTLFNMQRILTTMSSCPAATPLADADYQRLASKLLSAIEAAADRWLQDDVIDIDTQRTGGLLELFFPNDSRLIVNTQPPLQEIWLAARAGGYHYRHVQGRWLDTRDGSELFEALSRHASAQAGKPLRFDPP
jgi:CyaY protein